MDALLEGDHTILIAEEDLSKAGMTEQKVLDLLPEATIICVANYADVVQRLKMPVKIDFAIIDLRHPNCTEHNDIVRAFLDYQPNCVSTPDYERFRQLCQFLSPHDLPEHGDITVLNGDTESESTYSVPRISNELARQHNVAGAGRHLH